ncbi:MAG: type II toxin-antitoxin system YafO family toxin [Gammaproteobacteria bacterium]|nr:type II toxin-antitoxin system YafO family toxin [Gammaproteobacteria bacterium]
MIQIFKSQLLIEQLEPEELADLVSDFREYQETSIPSDRFGRDALYNDSYSLPSVLQEEVAHLHLVEPGQWPGHCSQYNRTSDIHLAYCRGYYNTKHYLLMLILKPNAHELARDNNNMHKLAKMAARFREDH